MSNPPCCPSCKTVEETARCVEPGGSAKPSAVSSPSLSLASLRDSLPLDIQSSILGYVLEEVYVFVIDNGKADDLKSFLESSRFKNILSKKENGLTTVTAQKEQVFPLNQFSSQVASPSVFDVNVINCTDC